MIPTSLSTLSPIKLRTHGAVAMIRRAAIPLAIPLAMAWLIGLGCVEPPAKDCERTLTCAPSVEVTLQANCEWLLPNNEPWEQAPVLSDEGVWLWYGRPVKITADCDINLPATPNPDAADANTNNRDAAVANDAATESAIVPDATLRETSTALDAATVPAPTGTTDAGALPPATDAGTSP